MLDPCFPFLRESGERGSDALLCQEELLQGALQAVGGNHMGTHSFGVSPYMAVAQKTGTKMEPW